MEQYNSSNRQSRLPIRGRRTTTAECQSDILADESGAIMLITCLFLTLLILMAGFALDFGRAWIAREELQTAVDAASLSGSRQAERHVQVSVIPGWCEICCDEDGSCSCCCSNAGSPVRRQGREDYIIGRGGWMHHHCDIGYWLEERWIELPREEVENSAQELLDINWPSLLSEEGGGKKVSSRVETFEDGSPYYPSVYVKASGAVKTFFCHLVGIDEIAVNRSAQTGVFYGDIRRGWDYGRSIPPEIIVD